MVWQKLSEEKKIYSLKISRLVTLGASSIQDFSKLGEGDIGLVYPIKTLYCADSSVEIDTQIGKVNSLGAMFVGVDVNEPRWYLERLWAKFSDQNPCSILTWNLNPGIAILNKILHNTEPYYLDAMADGKHMLCSNADYTKSCIWTSEFKPPIKSLESVVSNSNIYEFLDSI